MMRSGYLVVVVGFLAVFVIVLRALFQTTDVEVSQSTLTLSGVPSVMAVPIAFQQPNQVLNQPSVRSNSAGTASRQKQLPLGAYIAPDVQLAEAHWQGLEAIPLTKELKLKLKLPMSLKGLLVDETTLIAAASGLRAGDIMVAINNRPVKTLKDVLRESKRLKLRTKVTLTVYREGAWRQIVLQSNEPLGFAQVETAPMILPGDVPPHPERGACTQCHPIGTFGHMVPDPELITLPAPNIRVGVPRPHRDRGPCKACHIIL